MGFKSLQDDVIERRAENGARVIFETYGCYFSNDLRLSPRGEELAETAEELGMSRRKLIFLRLWLQRVTRECEERLAREMTVMYTLNEPRDRILAAKYLTKQEAAELAPMVVPGELLDLDEMYGGVMVRGRHIFVSEDAIADGLTRYEPEELLNGLIHERAEA